MPTAVVVGSGPNGLAAAVRLALDGVEVTVLEEQPVAGGGARTLDLGLAPGVLHDVCSAVHPMAWASPFLQSLDLSAHGVELLTPEISYAQPLDNGRAGLAYRDLERTVDHLEEDGPAWRRLVGRLAARPDHLVDVALGDRRHLPGRRVLPTALRLASGVLEQGSPAWGLRFRSDVAPALLTGVAAHAVASLPSVPAAGTALVLAALAHAGAGWPIVRGGSGAIAAALQALLESHGGVVVTDHPVRSRRDLPAADVYLFDTAPRTVARVLADELPARTGERRAVGTLVRATPLAFAHLAATTPPERMGRTMGTAELGRELGDAGGPILVGAVAVAVSLPAALLVLASVTAGTAVVGVRVLGSGPSDPAPPG